MGTYYGLEIVAGIDRQIFFCEKGIPPTEFLTLFLQYRYSRSL